MKVKCLIKENKREQSTDDKNQITNERKDSFRTKDKMIINQSVSGKEEQPIDHWKQYCYEIIELSANVCRIVNL